MANFRITIEETSSQDFDVEANTQEEAIKIAKEKWNFGEFCMDDPHLVEANLAVVAVDDEYLECPTWENL